MPTPTIPPTASLATAALAYAAAGWHVFPLVPGKKTPIHRGGVNDASNHMPTVRGWWAKTPTANIGIALARSGLMVVDLDVKPDKGVDGRATLLDLSAMDGPLSAVAASVQRTPSGGLHHIMAAVPGLLDKVAWAPGVDILTAPHRYIVAAPSVIDGGKRYSWANPQGRGHSVLPGILTAAWRSLLSADQRPAAAGSGSDAPLDLLDVASMRVPGVTLPELESILAVLDPAMGRDDWLKVIWAAAAQWSGTEAADDVVQAIEDWSARTTTPGQYKPGEVAERWAEHGRKGQGGSHVTWRTVRSMAKAAGWIPTTLKGLSKATWRKAMISRQTSSGESVWDADPWNVAILLSFHDDLAGSVRRNLLTGTVEVHTDAVLPLAAGVELPKPYDKDSDWIGISKVVGGMVVGSLSRDDITAAVKAAADVHRYDPMVDYLRSLRWDGVARLDGWLHKVTGCPNTPLNRAVGRAWMVGMAGRGLCGSHGQGVKMDSVLVLAGPEGVGKSSVGRILGGDFYAEFSQSLEGDDIYYAIERRMLMELSELDSLNKSDANRIKALISTQADVYRRKYDAHSTERPRRCVFLGTTNDAEFLTRDMTMRRWWVVQTGSKYFDLAWLKAVRGQLLAEAIHLWDGGELPVLPEALRADHATSVEDVRVVHPYEDLIQAWLARRTTQEGFSVQEIAEGALSKVTSSLSMVDMRRIGGILRALGYRKERSRKLGRITLWVR